MKYAEIAKVLLATEVDSLVYNQTFEQMVCSVPPVKYQGYFYTADGEELEDERVSSESLEALITYIIKKGYVIKGFYEG